ncbi:alpha/beta hydrolase [Variovorax dokdonensis]|uniref:Alpha/beta hydrolase n=1 Tax=Variovorax dokdonensis TaxID=344883 RepID=A0ABT7N8X3_9BURK|nr:alpha/beta hydrolase [Variovorax dokdonensis]MDM0044401.1 alpha/beta hydrolase [Variovorax dokdonensis]
MNTNLPDATRNTSLFGGLSGRFRKPAAPLQPKTPLVVAIHGGTYTSAYFDVPGASLLDRAEANGIPIVAPDRPGYVDSAMLPGAEGTIGGQATALTHALHDAWTHFGEGTCGMVLIGHSIGGAIAATIASDPRGLPLIGLAVSGVGMLTPPEHQPMWEALPDLPIVEIPAEAKAGFMFGPEGSFDPGMPALSTKVAGTGAPRAELVDIVSTWSARAPSVLGRITVPVHYRQAEIDHLWICGRRQVDDFAHALSAAARVDAAMVAGTGHCMDFHHVGRSLQLQQLAFALQCAAQAPPR